MLIELSTVEQWVVEELTDILTDGLSNLKPKVQRVLLSFSSVFEPSNRFPLPCDHDRRTRGMSCECAPLSLPPIPKR